jgi:ABC-type multidrug transport system ATPase subunit
MSEWAIEVEGLTKSFGHHFALKKVNLRVKKGRFLTIFGPNGAGKTTLIRTLSTLTKPTSGNLRVAGFDLEEGEELRRRIGVISHQTFLYDDLTAYENIRFYGRMYDVENLEPRVEEVIEEVGLSLRKHELVRTFSRGMQQRLSIARAIVHHPEVLFFDEPYSGLDQHAAKNFKDLLKGLHTGERTIVMTTHDLSRGLEISDRVAILVRGRMVYEEEIKNINREVFEKTYFAHVDGETD